MRSTNEFQSAKMDFFFEKYKKKTIRIKKKKKLTARIMMALSKKPNPINGTEFVKPTEILNEKYIFILLYSC